MRLTTTLLRWFNSNHLHHAEGRGFESRHDCRALRKHTADFQVLYAKKKSSVRIRHESGSLVSLAEKTLKPFPDHIPRRLFVYEAPDFTGSKAECNRPGGPSAFVLF